MSESRRLILAAGSFLVAVAAYVGLVFALGPSWSELMAAVMLPYSAIVATVVHKKFLQ